MLTSIISILLPALCLAQAEPAPTPGTQPTRIERAVEQLGNDSFAVREAASRLLRAAGKTSETALEGAAKSKDAEVAVRARRILEDFRYGLYPGTPEKLALLIKRFRHGDLNVQRQVLKQLLVDNEIPTLTVLLEAPRSKDLRAELSKRMADDASSLVSQLLTAGDSATAERLLEFSTANDRGMRNYAVYYLLRNQFDAKIAKLRASTKDASVTDNAKFLAYMLWVKGDLPAARRQAEKAENVAITKTILITQADWKELARLEKEGVGANFGNGNGEIIRLSYLAAYHRMAGDTKEFEKAIAAIKKQAADAGDSDESRGTIWRCAIALLLNNRTTEGIELARKGHPSLAFELLACRYQYREALAMEGVDDPHGSYANWMKDTVAKQQAESEDKTDEQRRKDIQAMVKRFDSGLRVAGLLNRLGERQKADDLFDQLAKASVDNNHLQLRRVYETEMKVGRRDEAFEHALTDLERQPNRNTYRGLFPKQETAAETWWRYLRGKYPDESIKQTAGRLRELLTPDSTDNTSGGGDGWKQTVQEAAQQASRSGNVGERTKWLSVLGDTCLAHGETQMARDYFIEAADLTHSTTVMRRIADMLLDESAWLEASEWYRRTWERERGRRPAALYLQGYALTKAGRAEEGKKLIELALLLPLGEPRTRYSLASELNERGLEKQAIGQWQLGLRLCPFGDSTAAAVALGLAKATEASDKLAAADYARRALLDHLNPDRGIGKVTSYLNLPFTMHKDRAAGLMAAGRVDEALKEARLAQAILPNSPALAEELVPELDKINGKTEADRLFEAAQAAADRVLNDFPNSALHHNSLAWLDAKCNRRLDDALQHANRALELVPDNPAYIDTLAEVHFQRGDSATAIKHIRRCMELEPDEKHYKEQLERFSRKLP